MARAKINYSLADDLARRIQDLDQYELRRLRLILVDRLPKFVESCVADARMHKDKKNGRMGT